MCLEPWFWWFGLASRLMYTCMWSASPIMATPAMPEAPNLIQSWKITEETIMAEMMGRLGLACRGQGLVNAQHYTMESRGGRARGGRGDAETCFWSLWKQYEVGNYAHSSCLSHDSGIRPILLCWIISFQNCPFLKKRWIISSFL